MAVAKKREQGHEDVDRPEEAPAGQFLEPEWEEQEGQEETEALLQAIGRAQVLHAQLFRVLRRLVAKQPVACRPCSGPASPVSVELGTVMGSRAVKIVFPISPMPFNKWFRLNPRIRWTIEVELETRRQWRDLAAEAVPYLVGIEPFRTATIFIRYQRPPDHQPDADAFDYSVKYLIDALIEAGLLAGDSWSQLRYAVQTVCSDAREGSVEVTVVEGGVRWPYFQPVIAITGIQSEPKRQFEQ